MSFGFSFGEILCVINVIFTTIQCISADNTYIEYDPLVPCDGEYKPQNCGLPNIELSKMATVEDFDRCGPAAFDKRVRNYIWGAAGRKVSYKANFEAFKRISVLPRSLRSLSDIQTTMTTVLGDWIDFPVGIAAAAAQKLAHPLGEIAAARAAARHRVPMMLSCMSTTSIEDIVAATAEFDQVILWVQLYFLRDSEETIDIIRKAEKAGFKAIVVTIDLRISATNNCDGRRRALGSQYRTKFPLLLNETYTSTTLDPDGTFEDLMWIKSQTNLPIVVKGILTGAEARRAISAGASAIVVSNHGGRQLDGVPASMEVLPEVIRAVSEYPDVEVYLDGGVRNGYDVFKALASGAKAVFLGRPIMWGLGIGGEEGVFKVLSILKNEFNETIRLAGILNPSELEPCDVTPKFPNFADVPRVSCSGFS